MNYRTKVFYVLRKAKFNRLAVLISFLLLILLSSIIFIKSFDSDTFSVTSEAAVNPNALSMFSKDNVVTEINGKLETAYSNGNMSWIGNSTSLNSYTGISFVGNPSNSSPENIDNVKLELTSAQSQWINTSIQINFEDSFSPASFSANSLPSSRVLFSESKKYIDNSKWDSNKKYLIDLTDAYKSFIQKYPNVSIINVIIKGTGTNYARKFIYNNKEAKNAPRLIVNLKSAASPTNTPAPSATTIPTNTVTPTNIVPATVMPTMDMGHNSGDATMSAAMGLWTPNTAYDKCFNKDGSVNAVSTANIKAFHDSFKVKGPDGKWYPTWHPPVAVDPATGAECRFGHEHGRDPKNSELWKTKQIQNYFYYDANKNGVMDPSEEAVTGIPFGYANEQLDVYNSSKGLAWMRHEDHVGHKVEYANGEGDIATNQENNLLTGGVNVQNQQNNTTTRTGVKCYYLAKPHQGVSSPDAFINSVHEVMYFADCRDPKNAANNQKISIDVMMPFGQPGGFTKFMPLCGIERRDAAQDFVKLGTDSNNMNFPSVPSSQGDREIITRDCIEQGFLVPNGKFSGNLYEAWPASLKISDKSGKNLVSGINLLFDVEDANRYFYPEDLKAKNGYNNPDAKTNLGFTMDLCYDTSLLSSLGRKARGGACDVATNYGAIKDIKWNDPRSAFKGIHRGMYFQPGILNNAGGTEYVYADPFGKNAQSTPFPGAIKQQISNKTLDYSKVFGYTIDPRVNDRFHDTGKNTVHAPN